MVVVLEVTNDKANKIDKVVVSKELAFFYTIFWMTVVVFLRVELCRIIRDAKCLGLSLNREVMCRDHLVSVLLYLVCWLWTLTWLTYWVILIDATLKEKIQVQVVMGYHF